MPSRGTTFMHSKCMLSDTLRVLFIFLFPFAQAHFTFHRSAINRLLPRPSLRAVRGQLDAGGQLRAVSVGDESPKREKKFDVEDARESASYIQEDIMAITVYSKPSCVQCKSTYRALDSKGLDYEIVDLTEDAEALELVKSLGYMSAPVVITDTDHWTGFRPDKIATEAAK